MEFFLPPVTDCRLMTKMRLAASPSCVNFPTTVWNTFHRPCSSAKNKTFHGIMSQATASKRSQFGLLIPFFTQLSIEMITCQICQHFGRR